MNLICKHCDRVLAENLSRVDGDFEWIFKCEIDVVQPGKFAIGDGSYSDLTKDHIVVHLDDLRGISHPPDDPGRGYGCCGYWDDSGPNIVCSCGAEIGYELSDCAAPRMAHFSTDHVTLNRSEQDADRKPDNVAS